MRYDCYSENELLSTGQTFQVYASAWLCWAGSCHPLSFQSLHHGKACHIYSFGAVFIAAFTKPHVIMSTCLYCMYLYTCIYTCTSVSITVYMHIRRHTATQTYRVISVHISMRTQRSIYTIFFNEGKSKNCNNCSSGIAYSVAKIRSFSCSSALIRKFGVRWVSYLRSRLLIRYSTSTIP